MSQKLGIVDKQNTNIEVFIRIKPTPQHDLSEPACVNILTQKQITICEKQKGQSHTFSFDRIFGNNSSQEDIYQEVTKDMIDNAFEGINSTVFCYGQTCSGKTYTCIGKNLHGQEQKGLAPRIMQQILKRTEGGEKHIELKMRISIVQIHNQKIRDLLDHSKNNLRIRADKGRGVFLQNVTQKYILSLQQAKYYLSKGVDHRSRGSTGMNSVSSRSHMIIMINVHQLNLYTGLAKKAKITLVDLAGNEKLLRTGSEGKLIFQTKKINTSLSTLGKVINILSDGRKPQHVPYRQSKLTRLLQQSIGGNSITKLIINVSPTKLNYNQTLSSLRFGTRAKAIQNEPKVNKQYTVPQLLELLHKAQRKIKILTQVIKQIMKQKGNESLTFKQFVKMYLIDQGNGYQSNESELDALPKKVIESFSKRNSFKSIEKYETKRQYNLDSARSMKSFASRQSDEHKYIIRKNLLNTIPKIQPQKPCQRLLKTHRSVVKTVRSQIKSNQLSPLVLNCKRLKGKSKDKNNDIDNFLSQRDIKNNDSQESSIESKKNDVKKAKSSDSLKSSWCRSNAKSVCSINSRVLDLNVYNQSITRIKSFTLELGEVQSGGNSQYREESIEFNIQKIKQNFKKIESIRLKALIS